MKFERDLVLAQSRPSLFADLIVLTKARIGLMVGLSAFLGAVLARQGSASQALEAAAWITLVAGAGGVFNQVLERDSDRRMQRTLDRPLPSGRISTARAIAFGSVLVTLGVAGLALRFNALASLLALATLFAYVAIYTPLKRVSTLNTLVGAIPGAAPPLLGYVAIAHHTGPWAWALFGLMFVWQFPHFLAIAWLYREDYARAGMRMLPSMPGGPNVAARAALLYSLVLVPVALVPAVAGDAGNVYGIGALFATLGYVVAAALFALRPAERSARTLLYVSLVYLPLVLSLALIDSTSHATSVVLAR